MFETVKYLIGSAGPSGYGSKSTAEQVTEGCSEMHHVTAIITGATSGIGAETARVLAKHGARLVLPARNLKAAEEARARILSEFPDCEIIIMPLDLSSLKSVRKFVDEFKLMNLPLNLLINNAGRFCHGHFISEDGIEMTFATNYLGHFLLTKLLLMKMIETVKATGVQGRIVNVTSDMHSWFSGDMISYLELISRDKSRYNAAIAYALSKVANILHTKELARKLKEMEANVIVNCVHPGVVKTRLNRDREGLITGQNYTCNDFKIIAFDNVAHFLARLWYYAKSTSAYIKRDFSIPTLLIRHQTNKALLSQIPCVPFSFVPCYLANLQSVYKIII